MNNERVIFLNGPPGSGKDEGARIIMANFNARQYKMSRPLKHGLLAFFGWGHSSMKTLEEHKDERVVPAFMGTNRHLTWREMQISLAEVWMKPLLGNDAFGHLAVNYLCSPSSTDLVVISDCGFREELLPVIKYYKARNCLLIQLMREGCTFEGDSRSYVELDDIGVATIELDNRYPLTETDDQPITYTHQLCKAVRGWMGVKQED